MTIFRTEWKRRKVARVAGKQVSGGGKEKGKYDGSYDRVSTVRMYE